MLRSCVMCSGMVLLSFSQAAGLSLGVSLYASLDAPYDSSTICRFNEDGSSVTIVSGLDYPSGLAFDDSGNLYFADWSDKAIRRVSPDGAITTFANLAIPYALVFDGDGDLYSSHLGTTAHPTYDTVSKITPDGTCSTFASGLISPSALAFDSSGDLYVSQRNVGIISRITPLGAVSTFATGLDTPCGMAFDMDDNLYVSNWHGTIDRIEPDGDRTVFVSSDLYHPMGMAYGQDGYLYVANYDGYSISRVSQTGVVSTFASGLSGCPSYLAFGPIPEPSSFVLLATVALSLLSHRCRRNREKQ